VNTSKAKTKNPKFLGKMGRSVKAEKVVIFACREIRFSTLDEGQRKGGGNFLNMEKNYRKVPRVLQGEKKGGTAGMEVPEGKRGL